jgi:hypothetical protein
MTGRWPFPGDHALARARKVAQMYRAHLRSLSVDLCDEADATAVQFGETWAVPQVVTVDDHMLLTPAQTADWLCTSTANVRRLRLAGRLHGEKTRSGWRYKLAELKALQQSTRRRRRQVDQGRA